jgi:hypothetical protein
MLAATTKILGRYLNMTTPEHAEDQVLKPTQSRKKWTVPSVRSSDDLIECGFGFDVACETPLKPLREVHAPISPLASSDPRLGLTKPPRQITLRQTNAFP